MTFIPSSLHRGIKRDISGRPEPHSHFETVLSLIISFSASCLWVRPSSFLMDCMNLPVRSWSRDSTAI